MKLFSELLYRGGSDKVTAHARITRLIFNLGQKLVMGAFKRGPLSLCLQPKLPVPNRQGKRVADNQHVRPTRV